MSIKLQTMVWDLDLPLSRKMLMLSLADQANDEGFCWPDYETLARRCSVSRRTLFQCLSDLEQDGLVTRLYEGKPGQEKVIFQINLDALLQQELALPAEPAGPVSPPSLAGAKSAPVRNLHRCENRTGAKKRTDPVRNLHSIKQPSNSNHQGGGRAPAGTRLAPDWQPSAEDLAFARAERPDLDHAAEADKFRDYWHGTAGAKGRKADWSATWRNWIRRADAPKAGAFTGSARPAAPQRDWREPSETPLESAIGYIHQQYGLGAYGEGELAAAERERLIAEARHRHALEDTPA